MFGLALSGLIIISVILVSVHPVISQAAHTNKAGREAIQGQLAARSANEWSWRWAAAITDAGTLTVSRPVADPAVPQFSDRLPSANLQLIVGPNAVLWDQMAARRYVSIGASVPLAYRIKDDFTFTGQQAVHDEEGDVLIVQEPAGYRLVPTGDLTPVYVIEPGSQVPGDGYITGNVFTATERGPVKIRIDHFIDANGGKVYPLLYNNWMKVVVNDYEESTSLLQILPGDPETLKELAMDRTHLFRALFYDNTTSANVTDNGSWNFTAGSGDATVVVDAEGVHITPTRPGTAKLSCRFSSGGKPYYMEIDLTFVVPARGLRTTSGDGTGKVTEQAVVITQNGQYEVKEIKVR